MSLNRINNLYSLLLLLLLLLSSLPSPSSSSTITTSSTPSSSAPRSIYNPDNKNNLIDDHSNYKTQINDSKFANVISNKIHNNSNHNISNPQTNATNNIQLQVLFSKDKPKICSSIQIRNNLQSFEQLRNCNIIDGSLTIALVQSHSNPYKPEHYSNLTFPHLYEITEYLLFFRVEGLTSLSNLFPNLAVIRGKELMSNYAFVVYQMFHLQEINLPHLTDILRGDVRIENNPNLCYVTSVNWVQLCKHPLNSHFIKNNKPKCNIECPKECRSWTTTQYSEMTKFDADGQKGIIQDGHVVYCWSNKNCHQGCFKNSSSLSSADDPEDCCAPNCAGGCYKPSRADQCFSCRTVSQLDKCVNECADHLFEYRGKCITDQECINTVPQTETDLCSKSLSDQHPIMNLKPIKSDNRKPGQCSKICPTGLEEDPFDKNKCRPCDKGKCKKGESKHSHENLWVVFVE